MENKPDEEPGEIESTSKSARKQEAASLRDLGETLLALNANKLATIPLDKILLKALDETRGLKHRDARKRQLQYVGKLLRKSNLDEIQSAITALENDNLFFRQHFRQLERLIETLIIEGDPALNLLLEKHPRLDRQHLRQLIRQVQRSRQENTTHSEKEKKKATKNKTSSREDDRGKNTHSAENKLFNYLREHIKLGC